MSLSVYEHIISAIWAPELKLHFVYKITLFYFLIHLRMNQLIEDVINEWFDERHAFISNLNVYLLFSKLVQRAQQLFQENNQQFKVHLIAKKVR